MTLRPATGNFASNVIKREYVHHSATERRQALDEEAVRTRFAAVRPIVLGGRVTPLGDHGALSGIDKHEIPPPWVITQVGLSDDEQSDLKNHGGREKALHHYPLDHYAYWRENIGDVLVLRQPGAFGENLSTSGWTEETVNIGDIVRFGHVLLQVSQGRQPCWKLNLRFNQAGMARMVQMTGRTGWYYRVLEPGQAREGDFLQLIERPQPEWPVARVLRLLYQDTLAYSELEGMANLPELAEGWRRVASKRLEKRAVEDWRSRLTGQSGG